MSAGSQRGRRRDEGGADDRFLPALGEPGDRNPQEQTIERCERRDEQYAALRSIEDRYRDRDQDGDEEQQGGLTGDRGDEDGEEPEPEDRGRALVAQR